MVKNLIILPDGRHLAAGAAGAAIRELTWEQTVSQGQELEPGGVCAAMVEFSLLETPQVLLRAGDRITLVKEAAGVQTPVGVFIAQDPVRTGQETCRVTAFDPVVLLDQDVTQWFAALDRWPYSLWELAALLCKRCGVPLTGEVPPLGSLPVGRFQVSRLTGRELMKWLAQAMGSFCRADATGSLVLGWYTDSGLLIGPETVDVKVAARADTLELTAQGLAQQYRQESLTLTGGGLQAQTQADTLALADARQIHYRQGALQLAEHTCQPVQRVQIQADTGDVGVVYPQDEGEKNTYCITGNPVLQAMDPAVRLQAAEGIFQRLSQVAYTPGSLEIPAQSALYAGQTVAVVTPLGAQQRFYIMSRSQTGQTDRLAATGSAQRNNTTAVNALGRQLESKVLRLQTDVEGLRVEHRQGQAQTASLGLTMEGITAQVLQQQTRQAQTEQTLTQVQQTAKALSVQVQQVTEQGASRVVTATGYTFGEDGLRIQKSGQEMENLLDHTGMQVRRGSQVILRATARGVEAVDVTVGNYLTVGHARLEAYEQDRTACFYV